MKIFLEKMRKHKFFLIILPCVFLLLTLGNFLWHAYNYRQDIFAKFDHNYWEYRYNHSQWSSTISCLVTDPHINPHTCVWDDNWYQAHPKILPEYQKISIGDDGLYAYVGYAYIQGKDPSLVNAELPPFGKYLVGLFEITTGTMGIFGLFFTGLSLILFFFFTKMVFKSVLVASITTFIFSLEPLLIEQMRAPYLDTLYLSLLLLTAIFFLKQKYLFSGITLGLFMSVKSPFLGILVLGVYALTVIFTKQKFIKNGLILILSAGSTYIATYFRMFVLGHGIIHFIQVQRYIIHFYSTGAKGVIGAVIPMLLQGNWPTWFGPTLHVSEWTIFWPLSFVGLIIALVLIIRSKLKESGIIFQIFWILGYFAFLVITPIFPRYLLLVLPFMYNLSIWAFLKSIRLKFA